LKLGHEGVLRIFDDLGICPPGNVGTRIGLVFLNISEIIFLVIQQIEVPQREVA